MCGIIAYFGKKQAFPILINGLKKLEYRGYDSAGICISDNYQLFLAKKRGKVSELENELKGIEGNMGTAHTRGQPMESPMK